MEKKNLDWANLGFGYVKTDKRFVANYKDGAWDDGVITDDDKVVLNECAGVSPLKLYASYSFWFISA